MSHRFVFEGWVKRYDRLTGQLVVEGAVYDGDTFTFFADQGLSDYTTFKVRVAGTKAPEVKTSDPVEKALGLKARDWVAALIGGKKVWVEITGPDKYAGRWVGIVWLDEAASDARDLTKSVNMTILNSGLERVVPYSEYPLK